MQLQIESGGFRTELIWSLNLIWRCLFGQSGDFLIWSSSRSATASNSHALPYIVVELEVLASDQSGAFFSRSIVKSNLELCSCARPIAHHAPTATTLTTTVLLLQLQALYNVLFLILLLSPFRFDWVEDVTNFEPHLRLLLK